MEFPWRSRAGPQTATPKDQREYLAGVTTGFRVDLQRFLPQGIYAVLHAAKILEFVVFHVISNILCPEYCVPRWCLP